MIKCSFFKECWVRRRTTQFCACLFWHRLFISPRLCQSVYWMTPGPSTPQGWWHVAQRWTWAMAFLLCFNWSSLTHLWSDGRGPGRRGAARSWPQPGHRGQWPPSLSPALFHPACQPFLASDWSVSRCAASDWWMGGDNHSLTVSPPADMSLAARGCTSCCDRNSESQAHSVCHSSPWLDNEPILPWDKSLFRLPGLVLAIQVLL